MGLLDDEDEDEFTYADYDKEEKKAKEEKGVNDQMDRGSAA
jgi:hypothetical protein